MMRIFSTTITHSVRCSLSKTNTGYGAAAGIIIRHGSLLASDSYTASDLSIATGFKAVFLHGILGSRRNWRTPCKVFISKQPSFEAIAMDHRGHGTSPASNYLDKENTVHSCAMDVLRAVNQHGGHNSIEVSLQDHACPTLLIGHSFSGKVVLSYLELLLQAECSHLPKHVWILDSLPGLYDIELDISHPQSVVGILSQIMDLPREFESKDWLDNELTRKGIAKPIIQWISTNIIPVPTTAERKQKMYQFSFDIDTVQELFDDFCYLDKWSFLENYQGNTHIHFVRAGQNSAWTPEIVDKFGEVTANNPNIHLHNMPHVGHWLHAEDCHGMINIIRQYSNLN
mmetsp:Transcript_14248/g.23718  ORF Transcript_14248/g.23718 Transcript_14248/m.23718 type:complete len:342 (+) Transcript_14248:84-1109(+)